MAPSAPYGATWRHVAPYGENLWRHMAPAGAIWRHLVAPRGDQEIICYEIFVQTCLWRHFLNGAIAIWRHLWRRNFSLNEDRIELLKEKHPKCSLREGAAVLYGGTFAGQWFWKDNFSKFFSTIFVVQNHWHIWRIVVAHSRQWFYKETFCAKLLA